MTITIANVLPRQKGDALRLLFPEYADRHDTANRLLSTVGNHRLIGAFNLDSELVAAALLNASYGSVASLLGPNSKSGFSDARKAIIDEIDSYARQNGIHIIQSTVPLDQEEHLRFWESVDYGVVAKIEGRAKSVSTKSGCEEEDIDKLLFKEDLEVEKTRIAKVIELTFEDSKDLPYFQQSCSTTETLALIQSHATSHSTRFVVSYQDNDIGCVLLNHENDQVELCYFGVVPSSRGLGVGKKILQFSERWAKEKNASIITAYVDSDNCVARNVYDDLGFTIFSQQAVVAKEFG